ncbi:hypothetical protein P171DRAFT_428255 [Karstenula rhodostoma CBS 690.94]|uniref:5'-3' DNA helicase ZGRF1-like N-terminal domain-containing protein n=1 Tax=Karstenula rhodostoma CBS 690.94 TaxID=1392251 RepID=A0A9P4UF44_9PLEO|nr:hypothetical protein P171DRAFT_428255 [Karstenula rhodostoma CBS 690.94]
MTAPLRGTPRLSGIPASQNTAPVAEFRCLFTHDARKKQKKWQDGYLKFHSFNSRVIVYDASRFTVGDTYYKDSNELHEGDELVLDKGVMVEVAEPVGVTQTDLTPLFERKTKDSPQRNNAAFPPRPLPRPTIPASNPLRAASQPRHKSLNALLGTPRGPIGKAAPIRSPFEERREKENQPVEERAAKRQKTAHEKQAQQAPNRPTLIRETSSKTASSLSAGPMHNGTIPRSQAVHAVPRAATVINSSSQSEADNIPSDVTLPHTPSRPDLVAHPPVNSFAPARRESSPQQIPQVTPKLPRGKVPVPSIKAQQTPRPRPPPSSPPVSTSNRVANVDFAIRLPSDPPNEPSAVPSPKPRPMENRKTKTLKLSTGAKRGMLMCQSAPIRRRVGSDELDPRTSNAVRNGEIMPPQEYHFLGDPRRANIVRQGATGAAGRSRVDVGTTVGPSIDATKSVEGTKQAPLEILDDLELAHGFMDQQLLVTPSPPHLRHKPTTSKSPTIPKPNIAKRASTTLSKSTKRASEVSTEAPVPKPKRAKAAQPKGPVAKTARKKKDDNPEPPVTSHLPSPVAVCIPEETALSNVPAAPPEPDERVRPTSIPLSPSKLAALSTGGFKKKPKRAKAHSTTSNNPDPAPRPITVALPPHPLRSSKNGPLMSTTELSALLQSGPKSMRLEDDPIDDSTQEDGGTSPSKRSSGFKRSRSENDAPIPSTSDEWERRNLPKPSDTVQPASASGNENAKPKTGGLAALVKRTDPRRRFARAQSLNVDTPLANAGMEAPEVVSPPPVDTDVGPWSSEAFDLFDWRPPGKEWKAEGSKMALVDVSDEEDSGVGMLVDGR